MVNVSSRRPFIFEPYLVEDGPNTAEERPHAHLGPPFRVFVSHAHVEDLAVVFQISIVAELATSTAVRRED